jgi:hypothetical protein
MEIGDLRYLTASADAGNFSRAARMLGRNASTLSRRISRLENELGLPCSSAGTAASNFKCLFRRHRLSSDGVIEQRRKAPICGTAKP